MASNPGIRQAEKGSPIGRFLRICLLLSVMFAVVLLLAYAMTDGQKDMDMIKQRIAERVAAREASWNEFRDAKCTLVKAETREFSEHFGKTLRYETRPVRVWSCPNHAMFDEVNGEVPKSWSGATSVGGKADVK